MPTNAETSESTDDTGGRRDKAVVLDLLRAAADIERRLDRKLNHTRGISFSEYQLVRHLAAAPGAAAARVDLAEAIGLTPSAVTRALKPLEKMGYVTTERSERDARRALARLTPAGHELLADAEVAVDDGIESLDLDAGELAAVVRLLVRRGVVG